MNDRELDKLLQGTPVPERPTDYWEQFPKRVLAKLHWQASTEMASSADASVRMLGWGSHWRRLATTPQLRGLLPALAFGTAAVSSCSA